MLYYESVKKWGQNSHNTGNWFWSRRVCTWYMNRKCYRLYLHVDTTGNEAFVPPWFSLFGPLKNYVLCTTTAVGPHPPNSAFSKKPSAAKPRRLFRWPPKSGSYLLIVFLMMGILVPETCRGNKTAYFITSSWFFIFTKQLLFCMSYRHEVTSHFLAFLWSYALQP
jgi:hypothetical protein